MRDDLIKCIVQQQAQNPKNLFLGSFDCNGLTTLFEEQIDKAIWQGHRVSIDVTVTINPGDKYDAKCLLWH